MRLFIVDDDLLILHALTRQLRSLELQLEPFSGAKEAMAAARIRPPDALISDFNLPGISGLELIREMRLTSPKMRALLLSGGLPNDEARDAIKSGLIDRFLPKPWHLEDLRLVVQGWLTAANDVRSVS